MKTYFVFALSLFLLIARTPDCFSQIEDHPYLFGTELDLPGNHHVEKESDTFEQKFANMLIVLGLLIAFMIIAAWALKRMMKTRISGINMSSAIKIIETRNLSPRSTLYLLEVNGHPLLVGETASGITKLASFSIEEDDRNLSESASKNPETGRTT